VSLGSRCSYVCYVGLLSLGGRFGFSLMHDRLKCHSIIGFPKSLQWSVELAPHIVELVDRCLICI
jgi:hypothetical protein